MRRARTAVLSFGLLSIPVEIFLAIKDRGIHFHWLHAKCGSRIRNQMLCPGCNEVAEWADLVRVFEVSKGQYVQFTEAELDSLDAEANNNIELKEFIPLAKVDPIFYESTVYLGAGKGGEKAYRLLTDVMVQGGRAALAQTVTRGKEELVLIRPYGNGLILHTML